MSERFNGTWTLDLSRSTVWDDRTRQHVPDEVGEEVITLSTVERVQTYEVLYGDRPRIRMGYTAAYDDPAWAPYEVREVLAGADAAAEVAEFKRRIKATGGERERQFEVGQAYGLVRLVYVDERTHYRISRDPATGLAQSIMLRRLDADGRAYLSTVLDVHGIVYRVRRFVRA